MVALLLVLGLFDCLGAYGLLQVDALTISYAYSHGISDTIALSVWVFTIGWAAGIVLHLVGLQQRVERQQKAEAALLIVSSLWLTWLCAVVGAVSTYSTIIGDILHAAFSH